MGQAYYIGLMSGTSTDGIDGVILMFSQNKPQVLAFASLPFSEPLRHALLALNTPSHNELHLAALAANQLARLYAQVVAQLLAQQGLHAQDIAAIGVHGQTVRHRPQEFDGMGYTLQINQPAVLAELTGIRVIADFRARDLAAGGQGAPLVPAFHDAIFAQPQSTTVLLNIGGIANISVLPPQARNVEIENNTARELIGFDCGPGNALLDAWCHTHTGQAYDDNGHWGAQGQIQANLLRTLLDEPFFAKPPPKSTGRDLFNMPWLQKRLVNYEGLKPVDVQASLVALTAQSAAMAIAKFGSEASQVLVCGGGAYNSELMRQLTLALPEKKVYSSEVAGIHPLQVEAAAFAWLAYRHCHNMPGNLPAVTGAKGLRVLGASYPA